MEQAMSETGGVPDGRVTDIRMSSTLVRPGDDVRLEFDVENAGSKRTDTLYLTWYFGTTPGSELTANKIADGFIGRLDPGETESEADRSWRIPNLEPGEYWLTARLETSEDETATANNVRSERFTIEALGESVPLALDSASWDDTRAAQGEQVELTARFSRDVTGREVRFVIYEDDAWPARDEYVTSVKADVSGILATADWDAVYEPDGAGGLLGNPEYYFEVLVDGRKLGESGQLEVTGEELRLVRSTPAEDSLVERTGDFTLFFNEEVEKGSGTITIRQDVTGPFNPVIEEIDISSGRISIDGAIVTIDPFKELDADEDYILEVSEGAFRSGGGSIASGAIEIQFGTQAEGYDRLPDSDLAEGTGIVLLNLPAGRNGNTLRDMLTGSEKAGAFYVKDRDPGERTPRVPRAGTRHLV